MNRQYSQKLTDILEYSREEAGRLRCDSIGPEHLLLALLKDGHNMAADILSRNEVNYDKVFDLLSIKSDPTTPSMGGGDFFEDDEEDDEFPTERSNKNAQTISSKPQPSFLEGQKPLLPTGKYFA